MRCEGNRVLDSSDEHEVVHRFLEAIYGRPVRGSRFKRMPNTSTAAATVRAWACRLTEPENAGSTPASWMWPPPKARIHLKPSRKR